MTTCGHRVLSIFDAAQELQQRYVTLVENGGDGIDLEAYIKGTDGESNLDFAGAVHRATDRVEVRSCEICDGVVGKYDEGWQELKLVSKNGSTLLLSVKVSGPREDEECTDEDIANAESAYVNRGLARLASRRR